MENLYGFPVAVRRSIVSEHGLRGVAAANAFSKTLDDPGAFSGRRVAEVVPFDGAAGVIQPLEIVQIGRAAVTDEDPIGRHSLLREDLDLPQARRSLGEPECIEIATPVRRAARTAP